MKTGTGPTVLAERLKDTYRVLFENAHSPQSEPDEELRKLFHIHSGGGDEAMRLQIQTFKALSEYANFSVLTGNVHSGIGTGTSTTGQTFAGKVGDQQLPPIQVDLHIHLPENKTTRDYEAIIQDIAKYIYGRNIDKV